MASFTALNIDYTDVSGEDDVDNTKEIQIEEALKLYQSALKFHSEGPLSFDRADEAYYDLITSDIFYYPESQTEYSRIELYGTAAGEEDDRSIEDLASDAPPLPSWNEDSAPNTLPQILHLSFKNYGQFLLDKLQIFLRDRQEISALDHESLAHVRDQVLLSIDYFSQAADKDGSDLELWRKLAQLAGFLGSSRLGRYCWEAILADQDGNLTSLGLEEQLARQALHDLLNTVGDQDPVPPNQHKTAMSRKRFSVSTHKYSASIWDRSDNLTPRIPALNLAQLPSSGPKKLLSISPFRWDILVTALANELRLLDCSGFSLLPLEINIPSEVTATVRLTAREIPAVQNHPVADSKSSPSRTLKLGASATAAGSHSTDCATDSLSRNPTDLAGAGGPVQTTLDTLSGGKDEVGLDSGALNRKRSSESAGFQDVPEGTRTRSKRLRARDMLDSANQADTEASHQQQILEDHFSHCSEVDDGLFSSLSAILLRFGIESVLTAETLRQTVQRPHTENHPLEAGIHDLLAMVRDSDTATARSFLSETPDRLTELTAGLSLESLLQTHTADALTSCPSPDLATTLLANFLGSCLSQNMLPTTLAWEVILMLLSSNSSLTQHTVSSYRQQTWPATLKSSVLTLIRTFDRFFYSCLLDCLDASAASRNYDCLVHDAEIAQAFLELYIDHIHRLPDADRTGTWFKQAWNWQAAASQVIFELNDLSSNVDDEATIVLNLRLMWATTILLKISNELCQASMLLCLEDLANSALLEKTKPVQLPNSDLMPLLSSDSLNREIQTIRMQGTIRFLCGITSDSDPVDVIHQLEPLLEPQPSSRLGSPLSTDLDEYAEDETEIGVQIDESLREMKSFIDRSNLTVRLSLRQRLLKAYASIEYSPMVVSNYLRSLELLTTELQSPQHISLPSSERRTQAVTWLRLANDILEKILSIITRGVDDPFETVDLSHLRTSISSTLSLCYILHAHVLLEDAVAVGQIPSIVRDRASTATAAKLATFLHNMEIKAWVMLYMLFKEAVSQMPELLPDFETAKLPFLSLLHESLGSRKICKANNNIFLRMLRDEFLNIWPCDDSGAELTQVLKDMYDLSFCCSGLDDHTSEELSEFEALSRTTATKLVPFVISAVNSINHKDVLKSDVKDAIDEMDKIINRVRSHVDMEFNNEVITEYLQSPIKPLELFQCFKGIGELSVRPISHNDAPAADAGWYFLTGIVALNKFQAQARSRTQPPTDDLHYAIAAFMRDLEFSSERWETWYRLGQCYEHLLTEKVAWSIEKINTCSPEIPQDQRMIIHSYTMAAACAVRSHDESPEFYDKLSTLYSDFAVQLYSSTREPFCMRAFQILDEERRSFSGVTTGLYRALPFASLEPVAAWRLASAMLRRAIKLRPDNWLNHYTLSKTLWKVFRAEQDEIGVKDQVDSQKDLVDFMDVISSIFQAIDLTPAKSRKDPIVEPHYRLLSVVHKLVCSDHLQIPEALAILQYSSYSKKLPTPSDHDDWDGYVLDFLKALRSTDKAGWHHRMTARAAHVIYDDCGDEVGAMGAKHELMQQMFTKTMIIQVWKPEHQRPGRHFVYTSRYTRFMCRVLSQLGDKVNLEQLLKRLRKKTYEFFQHTALWQDCAITYVKLLRRLGKVPESHEDTVFKNLPLEDWYVRSAALDEWCHASGSSSPILDLLRDTLELKKLNNGLAKTTLMDDLLGDAYALLYSTVGAELTLPPVSSAPAAEVLGTHPEAESAVKPRGKGVGRREVHKKAEIAASRLGLGPSNVHSGDTTSTAAPSKNGATTVTPQQPHDTETELTHTAQLPAGRMVDVDSDSSLSDLDDDAEDELYLHDLSTTFPVSPVVPPLSISGGSVTAAASGPDDFLHEGSDAEYASALDGDANEELDDDLEAEPDAQTEGDEIYGDAEMSDKDCE